MKLKRERQELRVRKDARINSEEKYTNKWLRKIHE